MYNIYDVMSRWIQREVHDTVVACRYVGNAVGSVVSDACLFAAE
jgi:hypothetical protein